MYYTKHTIHILLLRCILYNSKGLTVKKVMVEVGKNKFCTGNRPKEILASPPAPPQPHPHHVSNLSVPKPYDVCVVCSRDMAELVYRSLGGQLNKIFQSVVYKCSHCFRV